LDHDLLALLRENYTSCNYQDTEQFIKKFVSDEGSSLQAIVLYGSCLSEKTRSSTSMSDYYLVVEDYDAFFRRRMDRILSRFLPPNIYFLEMTDSSGVKTACKYCVISSSDLERETGASAGDFYHLGRFSKRIAILWAKEQAAIDHVIACCASAIKTLEPHALSSISDRFDIKDFGHALLALSYLGEIRLEDTSSKIRALYDAHESFYDQLFSVLLSDWADEPNSPIESLGVSGKFQRLSNPDVSLTKKLIKKSRMRAKARWPKYMLTVNNWVDYLLSKLERTYGIKLELTPMERRFVLILGWRHYFRLKREGKIK